MLYLEAQDPDKDIQFYINSPGGSVTDGMAIYDTMQFIKCDVSTICVGMAASMGAFLLSSGTKGKRLALPNAEIMIHQPSGGTQGQATDMQIQVERMLKIKQRLNEILAANTGKPLETIKVDTERDNFMSAEEALEYGVTCDPYAVLMEVNGYPPYVLEERLKIRDAVKKVNPDCKIVLVVDENSEKKVAEEVRRAKKAGRIDQFIYGSISASYLVALMDTL